MNIKLSLAFGLIFVRIPLRQSPHIHHADALEIDWQSVLSSSQCSYILGNPPFIGAKYQKPEQRAQVRRIANLGKSGGTLDFVTAWFIKAGEYLNKSGSRIAFVSTNSITQGEQVAQLWPILFDRHHLEIAFAHRTFAWGSDARGKAHVHVVIVGLCKASDVPKERRLFSYDDINGSPIESTHPVLSPYLFDASGLQNPHLAIREVSKPINGLPKIITGSKPIDDGNYIFDREKRAQFLADSPHLSNHVRPFIGAREFIQGKERWIIHPASVPLSDRRASKPLINLMNAVRVFRKKSESKPTLQLADFPENFHVTVLPTQPFLAIPQTSSEKRDYAPLGWIEPPSIPSDKLRLLQNPTLSVFAILTSNMHMAWMRYVTGRMKSDYMYSIGIVYNNFPMPPADEAALKKLEPLAQAVLDARAAHPNATLADLYDPDLMPANLRKAHQVLDRAVDRLYRKTPFQSDRERVEHLFMLYEQMIAPLTAEKPKKRRRRT